MRTDAAGKIDHEADHQLGHRGDEACTRLRHQHTGLARRCHLHVADVDRAAQERCQLRQTLEYRSRAGRLPVGDDQVAAGGGANQGLALQRGLARIEHHLAERLQAGQGPLAVVVGERVRRVGQEYARGHRFIS